MSAVSSDTIKVEVST